MMFTVAERILASIELYAVDRQAEKNLRHKMRSLRCSRMDDDAMLARCYNVADDPDAFCGPCQQRTALWKDYVRIRAENRKRLRRIERLASRLSAPEPVIPEEPKPLLEMMGDGDDDENGRSRTQGQPSIR